MNKSELTEIIRNIVREEVEKALPNVLVEILASKVNDRETISERVVPGYRPAPATVARKKLLVEFDGGQPAMSRPEMKFSSNPVLNNILNETQGGIPTEEEIGSSSVLDSLHQLPQTAEVRGVAQALTKDYRSLLKAMDKKRP